MRLMPAAIGITFVRMAALLNPPYARLGLKMRATMPVRFALEGRVKRQISINLHSFHAPML